MSRPGYRKDAEKRRDKVIKFRCTPAEFDTIGDRATAIGVSRSELSRAILLDGKPPRRRPTRGNIAAAGALNRLVTEMKRHGNNLNQLARQSNAGFFDKQFEHRLGAALDELEALNALSRNVIEDLLEGAEAEGDA